MVRPTLAVLGECMVEVQPAAGEGAFTGPVLDAALRFGGDTLNCSLYLARLGQPVEYITALGDDVLSNWLLSQWRQEGVGCAHVRRVAGAVPGLYLITTDNRGERSFLYWRDQAPVRQLFDDPRLSDPLFETLEGFDGLYLSGITLALFDAPARDRLLAFLERFRRHGGRVQFDNNFRARQWADLDEAREAFERLYRTCDLALPTADDDRLLFGDASDQDIIQRLRGWGVQEVVLKLGADGCMVADARGIEAVAAEPVAKVRDTTSAGDSFNAGYLAARLAGASCRDAAVQGNRLAARVVQYPGAIMPREAMADLCA